MSDPHEQGVREPERKIGRDALGLALMAVAAFTGVSAFLAVRSPRAEDSGTSAFFVAFVGWLGGLPTLAAAAGLAWIGVRLWLGGVSDRIGRDLAGVAATSAALAALCGAVSQGLGGAIGDLLGGSVTRTLTAFVGVPFGLALLAFPVWFFWLRPRVVRAAPTFDVSQPSRAEGTESGTVPESGHEKPVTRLSRQRTEAETWNLTRATPVRSAAPSPYPPDVRRIGGIPEGARPLEANDVRPTDSRPHGTTTLPDRAPPDGERSGERARDDLAASGGSSALVRSDLAGGVGAAEPRVEREPESTPTEPAGARERPGVAAFAPEVGLTGAADPTESNDDEAVDLSFDELDGATRISDGQPAASEPLQPTLPVERTPPAPSWEQPSLFDDEPVDAYGTPLALVEEHIGASPAAAQAQREDAPTGLAASTAAESVPATVEVGDGVAEPEARDTDREPEGEEAPDDPIVVRDEDEPPAPEAERDVVIEPQPRPLAVDAVVYKAGCLFLERKRVAVSMLQREFSLDFAAATAVLDQLQQLGLIGPYLGGQRRDILLTPEEWRERVGAP